MKYAWALLLLPVLLFGCIANNPAQSSPTPTVIATPASTIQPSPANALTATPISSPSEPPSSPASLSAFNKDEYEAALLSGKTILLFFFSEECSDCVKQKAVIEGVMGSLESSGISGYVVNMLPPKASADEEAIVNVYSVKSSGTIIILGGGGAQKYR